ncbi:DUF6318 family protein [Nocardioides aequoreus]|uniref:DUF6318 family protein n=1 Tax=Nocardioides aequoreus TaxID=397278 RepID=UPI0004C3D66F|nr:DUF6318 family protein [Nocardioides aequoreus]
MRRLTSTAAAVACAALLVGCGGSPEAGPAPTPSPSSTTPSPTATATNEPPAEPKSTREKSREGAIEAAKYFLKTMSHSSSIGDTATFRSTFVARCTRCEAIADGIDETYSAGGSITGGEWVPTDVRFYDISGDVAVLDIVVNYEAQTWIRKEGSAPENFEPTRGVLKAFNLRWRPSAGWAVSALDPDA